MNIKYTLITLLLHISIVSACDDRYRQIPANYAYPNISLNEAENINLDQINQNLREYALKLREMDVFCKISDNNDRYDKNNIVCAAITVLYQHEGTPHHKTFYIKPLSESDYEQNNGLIIFESADTPNKKFKEYCNGYQPTKIKQPNNPTPPDGFKSFYLYEKNSEKFYEQDEGIKNIKYKQLTQHAQSLYDENDNYLDDFFELVENNTISNQNKNIKETMTKMLRKYFHSEQRLCLYLQHMLKSKQGLIEQLQKTNIIDDHIESIEEAEDIGFFLHTYSTLSPCNNCLYSFTQAIDSVFEELADNDVNFLGTLFTYDVIHDTDCRPHCSPVNLHHTSSCPTTYQPTPNNNQVPWHSHSHNSLDDLLDYMLDEENKLIFYGQRMSNHKNQQEQTLKNIKNLRKQQHNAAKNEGSELPKNTQIAPLNLKDSGEFPSL
jgi:hypothetical protein